MSPWSFLPLAGLLATAASAQRAFEIITLLLPPPAGEGFSILQAGGTFAEGAGSAWYNPALLADLERQTGSQLHFTRSSQDVALLLDDATQTFMGGALVFPDTARGTDLGVALYRNHTGIEFETWDSQRQDTGHYRFLEDVYTLGLGLRLGPPVSLGGSAQFIDSRQSRSVTTAGPFGDGTTRGWAFDLGLLANPRLTPGAAFGLPWLEVMPSLGLALRSLGPDVLQDEADEKEPLPTTSTLAFGIQLRFLEVLDFRAASTAGWKHHYRGADRQRALRNDGLSLDILGFRYAVGWLEDPNGGRSERISGRSLEFDLLRLHRFRARLRRGDWTAAPSALDGNYPFGRNGVFGMPFRANPRVCLGVRGIESRTWWFRDGKEAFFFNLSF